MSVPSEACDIVSAAAHPSWTNGGPCDDCAFRTGSDASQHAHTIESSRLCVEGFRPFHCHLHPGLCRVYVAAANIRGLPYDEEDRRWATVAGAAADIIGACIEAAKNAEKHG